MQEATLCYVLRDGEVLLIEKRRGLGEGLVNGPGGKLEPGESPRECAVREVREEVGIEVREVERAGRLTFTLDESVHTVCHVFRTSSYAGEVAPSPEARPFWVSVEDAPYDRMWPDDRLWLPGVLEGRTVRATVAFEGGRPLDEADFVDHDLEWDVPLEPATRDG